MWPWGKASHGAPSRTAWQRLVREVRSMLGKRAKSVWLVAVPAVVLGAAVLAIASAARVGR